MVDEVIEILEPSSKKLYVDATLGKVDIQKKYLKIVMIVRLLLLIEIQIQKIY